MRSFYFRLFCLWLAETLGPDDAVTTPRAYRARIFWLRKAGIKIGDGVIIRSGFKVIVTLCHGIIIKDHVVIGPSVQLWNFHTMEIGEATVLAGDNLLTNGGHDPETFAPISGHTLLGNKVLLDWGGKIVKPVVIGDGVVVEAYTVVTHNIECPLRSPVPPLGNSLQKSKTPEHECEYLAWQWPEQSNEVSVWEEEDSVKPFVEGWSNYKALLSGTGPIAYFSPVAVRGTLGHHAPNLPAQNVLLSFAVSLLYAANGKKEVSILDFGGAIGYYKLIAEKWLPQVKISYVVVDTAPFCRKGREIMPCTTFFESLDKVSSDPDKKYDFIVSSGSLQYVKEWPVLLKRLCKLTKGPLFLSRLPIVVSQPFVMSQRPRSHGFKRTYPHWTFVLREVESVCSSEDLVLVREFIGGEDHFVLGAPEQPRFGGYLFDLLR